jgi:hypothetical protein
VGGGESTTLELQLPSGSKLTYHLTVHDEGSGEATDSKYNTLTTATLGLAVRSVAGEAATTTASVSDVTVAPATLEPSDLGSLADQTVRIAADGRQLDSIVVIADENGQFLSLADPFLPILPPDGVSVGDRWDVEAHQDLTVEPAGPRSPEPPPWPRSRTAAGSPSSRPTSTRRGTSRPTPSR